MGFLAEEVFKIRKKFGNIAQYSTNWLEKNINRSSPEFEIISPRQINVGQFYFMIYDVNSAITRVTKQKATEDTLTNKTSNLENFSAILVLQKTDSDTFCAINFNFFPALDRIEIMDNFIEENIVTKEDSEYNFKKNIPDDMYKVGFNYLHNYAYEYTLRYYKYSLVSQLYHSDIKNIPKILTISTYHMTKVDEDQLQKIHNQKIIGQDKRDLEVNTVLQNYESLANELKEKFKEFERRLNINT
jgi:hypothetical protein